MKKYLIVNADDFGLNKKVNDGIIDAFKKGIVTSASLLVNGEGFSDALEKIKENPYLDIGLHLNVFRGRPVSKPSHLVGKNGNLMENPVLFVFKILFRKGKIANEIYNEFDEQIKKALNSGIKISHLDTEKHLHIFPFVFKIILELAQKHGIKAIRFPFETRWAIKKVSFRQRVKLYFMGFFYRMNKEMLKNSSIKSPDSFFGVSLSGKYSLNSIKEFISKISDGVNELSCHPGYKSNADNSYISKHRDTELAVLTNQETKDYLKKNNINLINFNIFYSHDK